MSSLIPDKDSNDKSTEVSVAPSANMSIVSPGRFALAIVLAIVADALSMIFPIASPIVDIVIAPLLIVILGFHWEIVPVIAIEMVPGLGMFPTWLVFVLYLYSRFGKNKIT